MAVGSASDRNSQSDEVRLTLEAYKKREAEQAKQNGQQLKHVTESAQTEIESVKAEHQRQMDELKTKTRDAISSRDMKYQKDIGELRELHQKQLQRVAVEADGKLDRHEDALKGEIKREEVTSNLQRAILKENYEGELKEKDANLTDYSTRSRDQFQQSSGEMKSRLTKLHGAELKEVSDDRNAQVGAKQAELRNYQKSKDQQFRATDRQHKSEVNRLNDGFEASLSEESQNHALSLQDTREKMQEGLARNRDKFEKAAEDLRDQSEASRDELAGTVGGRIGTQVRSLQQENRRLQDDAVRADEKYNHQKARELTNLRDAMTANIDDLEKNRDETLASINDRTHKIIGDKVKENDRTLTVTRRAYQEQVADNNTRQEERLGLTKSEAAKTLGHERITSDTRVSRLKTSGELREGQLRNYFDHASESMKDNFDTTLHTMRDQNQRDQQTLINNFTKQSQESDAKLQMQMGDIGTKYEKQMAEMKEAHSQQLREQQVASTRIQHELEKKSSFDLKAQAAQYDARIAKLQELHEQAMENARTKHEESLAIMTTKRKT